MQKTVTKFSLSVKLGTVGVASSTFNVKAIDMNHCKFIRDKLFAPIKN